MAQSVSPDPQATRRRRLAGLLPLALLLLAGCGRGRGDVEGEVTYKGEPVDYGQITFASEVGRHEVKISYIVRGKYKIEAFPAGPAKISVVSYKPPTKEQLEKTTKDPNLGTEAQIPPELKKAVTEGKPLKHVKIPSRYADAEKSELTYTVEKGDQTKNFDLKEK